ncbi:hypothetical protein GUJ93_ZPchr0010g11290 [Zizania palustris]|uniref:Mre11 DNA-binding domain-containing protein n=1 Tax=Zizania palustris TaxID=103762 RepID=A0A8J5WAD7_ZIZPA|nr:hypothetical protein GUJ93_ZPchr0010g11290 [Zizania palustris]
MKQWAEDEGGNTLRILVATDCHLGYLEKDEICRLDTFDTFEEICSLAVLHKADFILLGGDLFHDNNPSHSTLVKCMEIIRRYCLQHDRPVQFQVVSDEASCLHNRFGVVNFEDPNFKVGLPVFTIHGSHDSPAGVDGLSAVDILSACNLVNYFGKVDLGSGSGAGQASVFPIFIRKGATLVALYGLGNIQDAKLSSMFQEVPGKGFQIIQPGSSVATSLSKAEAKPKHVFLLEIKGRQYRQTNIPLKSVRPFEYVEVALKDQEGVELNREASVYEHLDKIVRNLIDKTTVSGSEPKLPLVRVKVDYYGFSTIIPQRFGHKYIGKVANPNDILVLSRSTQRHRKQGSMCPELTADQIQHLAVQKCGITPELVTVKILLQKAHPDLQLLPSGADGN